MKKLIAISASAILLTSAAYAGGSHTGGHGAEEAGAGDHGHGDAARGHEHQQEITAGEPGKMADVDQRVTITMSETDDGGMIFEPKSIDVTKGQTVLFNIKNVGELEHEFVLDHHDAVMEHKGVMEKFPEMEHDDANSIRLEPSKSGEIIWKFTGDGQFEFACLIPGHYDAGMKGDVHVTETTASN